MKEFLILLGWLSVSGGILALAVAAVGRFSQGRLSRAFCCGLWVLVLLRLVLPFGVPGGLKLHTPAALLQRQLRQVRWEQRMEALQQGPATAEQPAAPQSTAAEENTADLSADPAEATGSLPEASALSGAEAGETEASQLLPLAQITDAQQLPPQRQSMLIPVLFWGWASLAAVRLLWLLVSYGSFRRRVLRGAQPARPEDAALLAEVYGGRRLKLVRSTAVDSAMVFGILRPVAVLPVQGIAEAQTGAILLHEVTHYRRGDLWLKWAAALAECIHWFNPLVWFMWRQVAHACELACDEAVIRTMTQEEKMQYGDILIASAGQQKHTAVPVTAICEEKQLLRERLVHIVRYKKRGLLSVFACVCLLALLCGCAAAMGPADTGPAAGEAVIVEDQTKKAAVEITPLELPEAIELVRNHVLCGGRLWKEGIDRTEEDAPKRVLVGMDPAGGQAQVIPFDFPVLHEEYERKEDSLLQLPEDVYCTQVSEQLIDCGEEYPALLRAHMHYQGYGEGAQRIFMEYRLGKIGANGVLERDTVMQYVPQGSEVLLFHCSSPGVLWFENFDWSLGVAQPRRLLGLSTADGAVLYDIPVPVSTAIVSVQPLADNLLAVHLCDIEQGDSGGFMYLRETGRLCLLDLVEKEPAFGRALELPESFTAESDFMLADFPVQQPAENVTLYNHNGLYVWDITDTALVKIYDWAAAGLRVMRFGAVNAASDYLLLPDGTMFAVQQQEDSLRLLTLRPAEDAQQATEDGRQVITVGGWTSGIPFDLQGMIADFNLSHTDVRVELMDYSDEAGKKAGLADGSALLERDIIMGKGPDILLLRAESAAKLTRHGALADLYPLLDADEELSRSDILPNILAALETEGCLPALLPNFNISTATGNAGIIGAEPGWSYAEFETAVAAVGTDTPINGYIGRREELWWQLQNGGKAFIDHAAGRANLNSPRFIALLETIAGYPEQAVNDYEGNPKQKYADGTVLLQFTVVQDFKCMREIMYEYDNAPVFKGYPNDVGTNGSWLGGNLRIGINAASDEQQLAWQFLRMFLQKQYQDRLWRGKNMFESSFPINTESLQAMAQAAQIPDKGLTGVPGYLGTAADWPQEQLDYWKRGVTDEEIQMVMELIASTETLFQADDEIFAIVNEEAAVFFAGGRTAQQTAAILQDRVQTYLDEQS